MPIATGNKSDRKFFAMRFSANGLLALILFASCAAALHAQSVQIMLVNGKTGRPITDRPLLNVWVGHEREFPFEIPTDKHGVAPLRLTHNDSEINVPDCKGMQADSEKLQMNRNKKDEEEFNKKYKYCTAFEVNNPVVRFADSISIGPVIRALNGGHLFPIHPMLGGFGYSFLDGRGTSAWGCGGEQLRQGHRIARAWTAHPFREVTNSNGSWATSLELGTVAGSAVLMTGRNQRQPAAIATQVLSPFQCQKSDAATQRVEYRDTSPPLGNRTVYRTLPRG